MKLHKFKIQVTSTNTYEREIVAENEDKAIDTFMDSLSENDKISENDYAVEAVENVGTPTEDELCS
jgi:hypothetical protein